MFALFKRNRDSETIKEHEHDRTVYFDDNVAHNILVQIKKEFGLDYSKQEHITMRKIERFAIKNEIYNFEQLQSMLTSSAELKEQLINMLTVGETYFYRELGHVKILVELMQQQHIGTILCAPSSSGEEVYSILLYILENTHHKMSIDITGIDVNSNAIEAARHGCYSRRSISLLSPEIVQKYFIKSDSKYCISSAIKSQATFKHYNVFDNSLTQLGTFDVIFSRNMLIYFNDNQKKEALANLRELLVEGGVLFIGHADISFVPEGFEKIFSPNGSYLKKMYS